jgi:hypothetical protein
MDLRQQVKAEMMVIPMILTDVQMIAQL